MSTLTNTRIKDSYKGLLKLIDSEAITGSNKEITDGYGNPTGIFINNTGNITIEGGLTAQGVIQSSGANIVSFQFALLTDRPNATTYGGALAYVVEDTNLYLASAGAWVQITKSSEIASLITDIASNTAVGTANGIAIGTNTTDIGTNTTDIATFNGLISTNTTNIATNTATGSTNTGNITTNASGIATNLADISTNTGNISTNTATGSTNAANIATNVTDISALDTRVTTLEGVTIDYIDSTEGIVANGTNDTQAPTVKAVKDFVDAEVTAIIGSAPAALDTLNELAEALADDADFSTTITASIGANTTNIGTNDTEIATNVTNIATNVTDIATNASGIATNVTNIATNVTNIATNVTDISTNATDISTNAGNISTNSTDISTNAGNISTNVTNIATNAGNISNNTTDVATALGYGDHALAGYLTVDANTQLSDAEVKAVVFDNVSVTGSGASNIDFSTGVNFHISASGAYSITTSNVSGAIGQAGNIIIKNTAATTAAALPAEMKTPNGDTVINTNTSGAVNLISYYIYDATTILVNYVGNFS